jgi:hypothetical protein|uniref:hypothetical protein n=1 Tax=Altererythrobacter segetis TaxID=1104773 RepID=UPI00140D6CFD|nr:hypothetical protein [Altererythrobacter segetis]
MTDEHLMRLWADAHNGFSADLDRGTLKLDRFLRDRPESSSSIGRTYAQASCATAPADDTVSTAARAALAGVTACLATMGLVLTVALLATADMHPADAHPVIAHTIVA